MEQNLKGIIFMEKNKAMEFLNGKMEIFIKGILLMGGLRESGFLDGEMVMCMMVIGRIIQCPGTIIINF